MTLVGVREVAERVGMSRTWVLRRVKSGELPAYRIGGRLKFDGQEVNDWVKDSAVRSSRTETEASASDTT